MIIGIIVRSIARNCVCKTAECVKAAAAGLMEPAAAVDI